MQHQMEYQMDIEVEFGLYRGFIGLVDLKLSYIPLHGSHRVHMMVA